MWSAAVSQRLSDAKGRMNELPAEVAAFLDHLQQLEAALPPRFLRSLLLEDGPRTTAPSRSTTSCSPQHPLPRPLRPRRCVWTTRRFRWPISSNVRTAFLHLPLGSTPAGNRRSPFPSGGTSAACRSAVSSP